MGVQPMKLLTTGEMAKLFNVTKYKIRHYVDKGLLTPRKNEANNYYFFGETDIYRLYQVNTLREIGFSIKEIQASLERDTVETMFEEAEAKVQREIEQLLATKKIISKIVDSQKKYKLNEITFFEREERYYKKVMKQIVEADSIDYSKAVKHEVMYSDELYYILPPNNVITMCLKSTKEDNDYVFPSGTYACKSFVVKDEQDVEEQVNIFLNDLIGTLRDSSIEELLLYENIYCSLAYNDKMVYSIEVKL
jgi:DNA-binding transcriptional MerR regulator